MQLPELNFFSSVAKSKMILVIWMMYKGCVSRSFDILLHQKNATEFLSSSYNLNVIYM